MSDEQGPEAAPYDGLAYLDNSGNYDSVFYITLLANGVPIDASEWMPDGAYLARLHIEPASAEDWAVWNAAEERARKVRFELDRIFKETRPKPCAHCGCVNPPSDHDCITYMEHERSTAELCRVADLRARTFADETHATYMAKIDATLEALRKLRAWQAGQQMHEEG